jgi:hypothetical protein
MVIRAIPHILAIRAPEGLIRRREARNWPTVLDRFARSHTDDAVLLAVSDTTHLPRRRTICLVNWTPRLSVLQPLFSLYELLLTVIGQSSARARPCSTSRRSPSPSNAAFSAEAGLPPRHLRTEQRADAYECERVPPIARCLSRPASATGPACLAKPHGGRELDH